MSQRILALFSLWLLSCLGTLRADEPSPQLCEPWQSAYVDKDATGEHVIGLWRFDADKIEDASGHGHQGALRGAKIHPDGRFGACLESFPGVPVEDKEHRALIENAADLSPQGAFTLELWMRPKPELDTLTSNAFLLDKKYASNNDYQLVLSEPDAGGQRVVTANLGFGGDSSAWRSKPLKLASGTWHHLAFTYDGKGTGCFYLDDAPWGSQQNPGRGSITAGTNALSIGDRIGSCFGGFPGYLDEVRLSRGVREFGRVRLAAISDRTNFLRMESPATLHVAVTNLRREAISNAEVVLSLDGQGEKATTLDVLPPGKPVMIEYPIDTSLRPDAYRVLASVRANGEELYRERMPVAIRIVPRQPPHRFPVLMWGIYSPDRALEQLGRLKQIGFNHVLGLGAFDKQIWEAGKPIDAANAYTMSQTKRLLDEALANDMTIVASLSPALMLAKKPEFQRVERDGQPYKKAADRMDVCGLSPGVSEFCYNVGASVAKTYEGFPAFGAALLHTEVRDNSDLCFHKHDVEAYRKASGADIPPEARYRSGVDYHALPNFPADRVIPDNDPIYAFYRWFWKTGDGWNGLNSALHRGLKSTGRSGFWTFHDPAVRVPCVFGSGGDVDVLAQWTYSYPNPISLAVATDELLAMAGGDPAKQVMKMTQIIWYRSQTAPIPKKPEDAPAYQAPWEREQPGAEFITISPMHLREAFWSKIARPIKGIMYHGWESLVPHDYPCGYCYTNPDTQDELSRLIHDVLQPLGPTLLETPGVKSDVAFLESFASQMFAGRGSYSYNGWTRAWPSSVYQAMLYAHLQPEIVFDETIAERGLDGFRVLVMPDCDVLTQSIAERIKAFQARGGIVVGDEHTAPAIKPDILLAVSAPGGRNDADKAALLTLAAELRRQLDPKYARPADTSNPEIIPYRRRYRDTDYVFVVNDRREYGQYVGQHGLVMENGLPSQATVTVQRPEGFVYDLVGGRQLAARQENGRLLLDVDLGPCDGRVYMVSPQAIDHVSAEVPDTIARGARATCRISVLDPAGRPVEAVVPLQVTIHDSDGRVAEFSGFYAAVGGSAEIPLEIAPNDPMGAWRIEVREGASGRTAAKSFRVPGPDPWPPARKSAVGDEVISAPAKG